MYLAQKSKDLCLKSTSINFNLSLRANGPVLKIRLSIEIYRECENHSPYSLTKIFKMTMFCRI